MNKATVVTTKGKDYYRLIVKSLDLLGGHHKLFKDKKQVFIKPNWVSFQPDIIKTNLECIREIASIALANGAKTVVIGENPTLGISSRQLYKELRLNSVFKDVDVKLVELDRDALIKHKIMPEYGLKEVCIPESVLESDYFINVPAVKTHGQAVLSLGIKNLIGLLPDNVRMQFHREDLHFLAVAALNIVNPQLTIIDGIVAGQGQGPALCDLVDWGVMFVGTNTLSTDAICASSMGFDPKEIPMIRIAHRFNLGEIDPERIDLLGASLTEVQRQFKRAIVNPAGRYPCPVLLNGACEGCIAWIQVRMDRWEKENIWALLAPQNIPAIVCGKKVDPALVRSIAKERPVLAFGDCLPHEIKKLPNTILIKGCPPSVTIQEHLEKFLKLYG